MQTRLLVLGGTEFVGRAVVDAALRRDCLVTVLNRGHNPPPPGVTSLVGDRSRPDGMSALSDGQWDVVVDTWSWAPTAVRDSCALLRDRAERYAYVSSRSVYEFPTPGGATEDAPLVEASPDEGDVDYARMKAGAELAVSSAFGDRALLARAGLVLGPHENVGRLPWWLMRISRGGRVLAPGSPDAQIQYVDARDLASWILDAVGAGHHGAYNVVSPRGHATMGDLLDSCVAVTGSDAELVWTDAESILAAGVEPWTDLPVWLPPGELYDTLHDGDVSKAVAAGLLCRPIAETVADTWTWLRDLGRDAPQRPDRPGVGLDPSIEARLLG